MQIRDRHPEWTNKYYVTRGYGGYSTCIEGNKNGSVFSQPIPGSVLPNCVGYAAGRFNEIAGLGMNGYWNLCSDAKTLYQRGIEAGLEVGTTPAEGALAIWHNNGCGHVAVVEKVHYFVKTGNKYIGKIDISQSGWGGAWKNGFKYATHYYDSTLTGEQGTKGDKDWFSGEGWFANSYDYFVGFVYNPKIGTGGLDAELVPYSGPVNSGDNSYQEGTLRPGAAEGTGISGTITYTPFEMYNQQLEKERKNLFDFSKAQPINLLTSRNMVETPFIVATIGNHTFGSFTKQGTIANTNSSMTVEYPNFMTRLEIDKTNGEVNTYLLTMEYQIRAGDDPNLLDKIFSKTRLSGTIKLSYGDWSAPSYIYKDEEAMITKVDQRIDFASQKITYTLHCQSKALKAAAVKRDFSAVEKKGSDVIKGLLNNDQYGLKDVFPGMANAQTVANNGWIASDDKVIKIEAKKDTDVLSYLNYVAGSMTSITDTSNNSDLKNSTYHVVFMDDTNNEQNGEYFKVVKINTSTNDISSSELYEVDIGYPTDTYVADFSIDEDNSWSILYNYSNNVNYSDTYKYSINNDGTMRAEQINKANGTSTNYEIEKSWWTNVTKHPIKATLTIRGLLRPAILMTYVKINTYFYGQKHNSSGIYAITKQKDTIDSNGFRTVLSLVRIAGDV